MTVAQAAARRPLFRDGWILSPLADLAIFAGPLALAGILIFALYGTEGPRAETPLWAFVLLVVGCDVAHVWSTAFRTYLDPEERARRPVLYTVVPLACFAAGAALHLVSRDLFWRVLAYLAAFHFVRQQVGWMAYAARRAGERDRFDFRLDRFAVYAATVYPLLWWHANLPRAFRWFVEGDFAVGLPAAVATVAGWLHAAILAAWVARQAWNLGAGRGINRTKWLVLSTTWLTWYGGIVLLDSDLAFTATNVLTHGVPYLAVVHRWGRARWPDASTDTGRLFRPSGLALYCGLLAGAAFLEEWVWDRLVWHDHAAIFPGPALSLSAIALSLVVPLLAVPQATHYVLDAFLWRTGKSNPRLAERLGLAPR